MILTLLLCLICAIVFFLLGGWFGIRYAWARQKGYKAFAERWTDQIRQDNAKIMDDRYLDFQQKLADELSAAWATSIELADSEQEIDSESEEFFVDLLKNDDDEPGGMLH